MMARLVPAAMLMTVHLASAAAPVSFLDPNLLRINVAAGTALGRVMAVQVLEELCGGAANPDTRTYSSGSSFASPGNHWAVTCPLLAVGAAKLGLPLGTPFAMVVRHAGAAGEPTGVYGLYAQSRPFLNPASCSGLGPHFQCAGTAEAQVHVGVSDLNPDMYRGINVPDDENNPNVPGFPLAGPDTAGMTIRPLASLVYGIAVTSRLYAAMFVKQGLGSAFETGGACVPCTAASGNVACVPSISLAELQRFLGGTATDWRALSDDPLGNLSQVNVCRRTQGSGVQAAINEQVSGAVCNPRGTPVARWFNSTSSAPRASSPFLNAMADGTPVATHLSQNVQTPPAGNGLSFVFEAGTTGDAVSCLNSAQAEGGYAIAAMHMATLPNANWKFVKLQGVLPLLAQAKTGNYPFQYEATAQYRPASLPPGRLLTVVPRFVATLVATPNGLASAGVLNGVMALPTSVAGRCGTGSANEITFAACAWRAGDACNALELVR